MLRRVLEQLGPYDIRGEVGRGATGVVYLGHDPRLDRPVAIKVLSPAVIDQTGFREGFAAEARLMAEIDDPNCVRIYDFSDGDPPYIVSEYIQGATLREVVKNAGRLTPEQSLGVLDGALAGLAKLHEKGLVHRDIKPDNIFCDAEGTSKLGDFGLAVAVGTVAPAMSTGSANYMSPELVAGRPVDARNDIYACGATLFELLTGAAPYAGGDTVAVMRQQQKGAVPDPRKGVPGIPVAVGNLVKSAMAKSPDARPATVADFRLQLEEAARKAFGAGWRTAGSIAGAAGAAIAAGTAATTALAAGGGTVLAAGATATSVGSATVAGGAGTATGAAGTAAGGNWCGGWNWCRGGGAGAAGGVMTGAGVAAKKGMSTGQKIAAGAAAVVVVAAVVVGANAALNKPATHTSGTPASTATNPATAAKLTAEDITVTGQISAHLTQASAFCNTDPTHGYHVGMHFKDSGLNVFLIGPKGPGPYHATEDLGGGQAAATISVRKGSGGSGASTDLISNIFKDTAITFSVNPDRLSGTVDADLLDSQNPQAVVGHVKGTWACVAGGLAESSPA